MANENYKCIFMGVLSNSITLSFLCNIISSTEAPGIESSGSKGNSHHAQIKVSSMISQHEHFSVNHFLSAGGIHCNTGKSRVSMHKEDCHCTGEAGGRSNGTYSNKSTLSLWSSPSEGSPQTRGRQKGSVWESSFRGLLVSFMLKRAPRKSSSLWEFTQAFEDGGRIIPNIFLYVSSQGEGISSFIWNLVFGTCQSLESNAVNFPRERSSYKWRKQHFFGGGSGIPSSKISLLSNITSSHLWIWNSATEETDYGRGKLLDGP